MATATYDIATVDPATGQKLVAGLGVLEGSNPSTVRTGLTTITGFVCTLLGSSAPGDSTSTLTAVINTDGTVSVYAWTNTSGSDPTLVASTGTERFSYLATGK